MKDIYRRLKEVFEYQNINSPTELQKKYGFNNTTATNYFEKGRIPKTEYLLTIKQKFEKLDLNWLFTGEGSMLKENTSLTINGDNNGVSNTGNVSGSIFTNTGNIRIENPTAETLYKQEILRLKNEIKLKEREALILERDVLSYKEIMTQMKESQELIKGLYERKIEDLKRTINILETRMESSNESRQNN